MKPVNNIREAQGFLVTVAVAITITVRTLLSGNDRVSTLQASSRRPQCGLIDVSLGKQRDIVDVNVDRRD